MNDWQSKTNHLTKKMKHFKSLRDLKKIMKPDATGISLALASEYISKLSMGADDLSLMMIQAFSCAVSTLDRTDRAFNECQIFADSFIKKLVLQTETITSFIVDDKKLLTNCIDCLYHIFVFLTDKARKAATLNLSGMFLDLATYYISTSPRQAFKILQISNMFAPSAEFEIQLFNMIEKVETNDTGFAKQLLSMYFSRATDLKNMKLVAEAISASFGLISNPDNEGPGLWPIVNDLTYFVFDLVYPVSHPVYFYTWTGLSMIWNG